MGAFNLNDIRESRNNTTIEFGRPIEKNMSVVREELEEQDVKVLQFELRTRSNHWETVYLKIRNSFMYFAFTSDFLNSIFKIDLLKIQISLHPQIDSPKFIIIVNEKDKYECRAKSSKMQS